MQHKFATTNGIQLHYVEEGSGELVILLHGFPEYWYSWRNQIPVLSKTHRVVAVDMRGFNLSDKPQDIAAYSMDKLAKDIADLIPALGEEKAILIGHDWGAGVAWATAILYPERISKLGIINVPHPYEMQKALKGGNISQLLKSYYIFLFQIPRLPEYLLGKDLKGFFKKTFKNMSPHKTEVSDEVAGQYAKAYSQPGALTGALNYYRAMLRYRKALPKYHPKLKIPILMLWGEQDTALGKELTLNTHAYCENLELIYDPTSGHFIQHDNPDLVNEKLAAFINTKY